MKMVLENELKKRGLRPKWSGTEYIREGVLYCLSRPSQPAPRMMKEVYPAIAAAARTNAGNVEHAARYALRQAGQEGTVGGTIRDITNVVRAYED